MSPQGSFTRNSWERLSTPMIAPRAVGEPLALYSSCVNSGYCLVYLSDNLNLPTENWKLNNLFFFPGPTQAKKTLKLFNLWDFEL